MIHRFLRVIETQVYRQVFRDRLNYLRFGAKAPLSAMAIYPRPRDIVGIYDHVAAKRPLRRHKSGLVLGGDWDTFRRDLAEDTKLKSCYMRWVDGADWQEIPIWQSMLNQIARGKTPDKCCTAEDVLARFSRLDEIFEETKARGRMLAPCEVPGAYYRRAHGATYVHIARDGSCLRSGGGAHRFAIAHVLDLPEVPAQLGVIHLEALKNGDLERLRISKMAPSEGLCAKLL